MSFGVHGWKNRFVLVCFSLFCYHMCCFVIVCIFTCVVTCVIMCVYCMNCYVYFLWMLHVLLCELIFRSFCIFLSLKPLLLHHYFTAVILHWYFMPLFYTIIYPSLIFSLFIYWFFIHVGNVPRSTYINLSDESIQAIINTLKPQKSGSINATYTIFINYNFCFKKTESSEEGFWDPIFSADMCYISNCIWKEIYSFSKHFQLSCKKYHAFRDSITIWTHSYVQDKKMN